jgi:hypothetical protein
LKEKAENKAVESEKYSLNVRNGRTKALRDFHRELESMCVSFNASRALKLSLLYTFGILLYY